MQQMHEMKPKKKPHFIDYISIALKFKINSQYNNRTVFKNKNLN